MIRFGKEILSLSPHCTKNETLILWGLTGNRFQIPRAYHMRGSGPGPGPFPKSTGSTHSSARTAEPRCRW